ncbi:MAG: hypothetical protein KC635_26865, partial [Myxococcales bacterium]|nr:hypothetical protein [Myxococcales bacterium]
APGEEVFLPVRPGEVTVRGYAEAGPDTRVAVLEQTLTLGAGAAPTTVAAKVEAVERGGPSFVAFTIDDEAAPARASFGCAGADKARATLTERPTDDGLTVTLTCPEPGASPARMQSLTMAFTAPPGPPAPIATTSVVYNQVKSLFQSFQSESGLEFFGVDMGSPKLFAPFVGAEASPLANPGDPAFAFDPEPLYPLAEGGALSFFTAAVTVGEFKSPAKRELEKVVNVAEAAQTLHLEYRTFDKLPETGPAQLLVEWATAPTALGWKPAGAACADVAPAEGVVKSELVTVDLDRGDPLYDVAHFDYTLGAFAEPVAFYVRVTRFETVDLPGAGPTLRCAQMPSNWITVKVEPFPGLAPCVGLFCVGAIPPPLPEDTLAVSLEVLEYRPPTVHPVGPPDYWLALDGYNCCDAGDLGYPTCTGDYCAVRGNPLGWPEGCVYDVAKYADYDATPWYEDLFDAILTIYESVAAFYNFVVDATVYTLAYLIPGCEADCDTLPGNMDCPGANVCGDVISWGVHTALVALGVPPKAPSVKELMDEGADYLVELGAEALQDQFGIPEVASRPVLEKVMEKVKAELKNEMRGYYDEENPYTWGIPSPYHSRRKGFVKVRFVRSTDPAKSVYPDHLTLDINGPRALEDRLFETRELIVPKNIAPGESVEAVVQLEPYLPCVGVCGAGEQQTAWVARLDGGAKLSFRTPTTSFSDFPATTYYPIGGPFFAWCPGNP